MSMDSQSTSSLATALDQLQLAMPPVFVAAASSSTTSSATSGATASVPATSAANAPAQSGGLTRSKTKSQQEVEMEALFAWPESTDTKSQQIVSAPVDLTATAASVAPRTSDVHSRAGDGSSFTDSVPLPTAVAQTRVGAPNFVPSGLVSVVSSMASWVSQLTVPSQKPNLCTCEDCIEVAIGRLHAARELVQLGHFDAKLPPVSSPELYVIPPKLLFQTTCPFADLRRLDQQFQALCNRRLRPEAKTETERVEQEILQGVGFQFGGLPLNNDSSQWACWCPVVRHKGRDFSSWPTLPDLLSDPRVHEWHCNSSSFAQSALLAGFPTGTWTTSADAFEIRIVNAWGDLYRIPVDLNLHGYYAVHAHVLSVSTRQDDDPLPYSKWARMQSLSQLPVNTRNNIK